MKSVGEAMAIGRTFKEAFLKALRSRELDSAPVLPLERKALIEALSVPTCERYELILHAFRQGFTLEELHTLTSVPRFFLAELGDIVGLEAEARSGADTLTAGPLRRFKRYGFSDRRLAELLRRRRARGARRAARARHRAGLQGGRHLRRRVRGRDALFLLDLRRRERGAARRARAHRHSWAAAPTA